MRAKLVIANWKMNGSSGFVAEMAGHLKAGSTAGLGGVTNVVVCPPHIYITNLVDGLAGSQIEVGAQNISAYSEGAYTGEISSAMLVDAGCRWVLVGHSERRTLFAESSASVAARARIALAAGLNTLVCIGETLEQRQSGETEAVIAAQLKPVLGLAGVASRANQLVFAYEPVWAIGTGETATPEQAQEAHAFIRAALGNGLETVPILYGGSVKPDNAGGLFAEPDIDGGLIGGASLNAEDFLNICRAMPA